MKTSKIECKVIYVYGDAPVCPGGSRVRNGHSWIINGLTPEDMCARSYMSVFPVAMAMRFSEETPWERGKGYVDITCPEGYTKFRLSRVYTG